MKKFLLATLLAIFAIMTVSAESYDFDADGERNQNRLRKKYRNISFSMQKTSVSEAGVHQPVAESSWGVGFTTGRSYILHRKPIARMLHIGLDATWFDINYVQSRALGSGSGPDGSDGRAKIHQGDITLFGFGPSVHLTPIGKLGIHTYLRYNPTFATYFQEDSDWDDTRFGYASMWVCGAAVSWGVISVGGEARWGKGKYHRLGGKEKELSGGSVSTPPVSLRSAGARVYVSFRF